MKGGRAELLEGGKSLGRYRIFKKLGAGGMGEVFLAEDPKLERLAALKILSPEVADDTERIRRFEQEAKAASVLNHPNILTIYEIGFERDFRFISSEFIEGETLRDALNQNALTLAQTLNISIQIVSALAAAHGALIVHRDIKPENVMIREDGLVKILDFGIAKLLKPTTETGGLNSIISQSKDQRTFGAKMPPRALEATTAIKATQPGQIMGTASYMSPEQGEGKAVDARSDIFSFGVVLYEMLSGRKAFEGETVTAVINAIVHDDPAPLSETEAPRKLRHTVEKCLRKDRKARYQSAKDLLADLKDFQLDLEFDIRSEHSVPPARVNGTTGVQYPATTAPRYRSRAEYIASEIKHHKWAAAIALTLGALVVSGAIWNLLPRLDSRTNDASVSLGNATFTQLTDQAGPEYFPSLSPDGKSFVYAREDAAGNWDIYLQRVGGKNPINLTKDSPADDTQPAFSPDGERIAFRSGRENGGIFVMGATGESAKRLTDFGFNPAWSPDGKEIALADEGPVDPASRLNPNSRVWVVNVATGERRPVTKEDSIQPNWSPRGLRIAYGGRRNVAQRDIWTIPAAGGEPEEVTNDPAIEGSPVWSPDGKYLYFASDRAGSMNLWRVPIEEQTGKILGPAEAVTTPSAYSAHVSFSGDGRRMVYSQIVRGANLQQVGFDPVRETITGQPMSITQGSRSANTPNLSPDGDWLTFDSQISKQEDLFIIRRDGTGLRQLTDDNYKDRTPRWSPDGKRIVFYSDRTGKWEAWTINSDGSGLQQITYAPGPVTAPIWSPDGTHIFYRNPGDTPPSYFDSRKSWTEQSPQALPPLSGSIGLVPWSWSPDGRKLALGQNVEGNFRTFVYSLESQQYEEVTDLGTFPVWLSDSRRLLFQDKNKLYLVDSESRKFHEVLSAAPHDFGNGVTLSRDNRLIYFSLVTTEADIWLMTLE